MIELAVLAILAGINIAFLAYHYLYVKENNKEKSKLISAIISKNATELRDLELTEKVKNIKPPQPQEPDLIPEADLSDDEFAKKVLNREVG